MNPVEIEEAATALAEQPFDAEEFPYAFLQAYGNKETTIKRLRTGTSNKSDVGGVMQRNNVHILVTDEEQVSQGLEALRQSPVTSKFKAKLIIATDGHNLESEDLVSGETIACAYHDFAEHFGFFLPLAGISTVKEIRESAFDIKATGRLNKLYLQLLNDNPEWSASDRRQDMNRFLARLIFSFFAEDTGIFHEHRQFTRTIEQMSTNDSSNTHEVIQALFLAMNTRSEGRATADIPRWADGLPYVNGGLFSGSLEAPKFSRIARSYLIHIGGLDWTQINPDIFGSMIQAVAEDEERSSLGMHYTSVPNILKVLNPLFLNDLREKLAAAGDNSRALLNLRRRIARIRVFDPACGSGNFLVIAYKEMRKIEAEVNRRRGEPQRHSAIPLTNFRGIEIRDFAAEIARLALVIAEYQSDVLHRGHKLAMAEFLPLSSENWITCGNALRLGWLTICPPTGGAVKTQADDLFSTPLDQPLVDFENEGGETFVCGNPPYSGKGKKDSKQLADMKLVFSGRTSKYGYVDYVGAWFVLAADYCRITGAGAALVATNSVCQGRQLPQLWPLVLQRGIEISFAHLSFKWANNAAHNAGVICVVVGLARADQIAKKTIFDDDFTRVVSNINAYLVSGPNHYVESVPSPLLRDLPKLVTGSVLNDGGHLILSQAEARELLLDAPSAKSLLYPFYGSDDLIQGKIRYCLLIDDAELTLAQGIPSIEDRLAQVANLRRESPKKEAREQLARVPHKFQHHSKIPEKWAIVMPRTSSERREWIPTGLLPSRVVVSDGAFQAVDAPVWTLALLSSRIHLVWVATVCGKLKMDYRYSNTLGWNTFPVPTLTEKNRADLTRCAENILLAREAHYPTTIAGLYEPEKMPANLRRAHEHNDEVLERIYVGRRFRNDTERLEKLFELYAKFLRNSARLKREAGTT